MNVGVYGYGRMGKIHAKVYKKLGHDVFIFDIDDKTTECVENGYTYVDNVDEFLGKIQLVSVCTPDEYHLKCFKECFSHDVPCLIEKPIAKNLESANEILKLLKENPDYRMTVGHIERFNPAFIKLKEILENEDIENISFLRYGPPNESDFISGAVLDIGVHDIDMILNLLDDYPSHIDAKYFIYGDNSVEDKAHISMLFGKDTSVSLDLSRRSTVRARYINVTTKENHYVVNLATQKIGKRKDSTWPYSTYEEMIQNSPNISDIEIEAKEPLKEELSSFIKYVTGVENSVVNPSDAVRAVELVEKIADSAEMIKID